MREFKFLKWNPLGHTTKIYAVGLLILRKNSLFCSTSSNLSHTSWVRGSVVCGNWVADVQVLTGVCVDSYHHEKNC